VQETLLDSDSRLEYERKSGLTHNRNVLCLKFNASVTSFHKFETGNSYSPGADNYVWLEEYLPHPVPPLD
jgi:hypothetical protein